MWHFFQTSTIIPELNTPVFSSTDSADKVDSNDGREKTEERQRIIEGILNEN
jgi:hypothetical protein